MYQPNERKIMCIVRILRPPPCLSASVAPDVRSVWHLPQQRRSGRQQVGAQMADRSVVRNDEVQIRIAQVQQTVVWHPAGAEHGRACACVVRVSYPSGCIKQCSDNVHKDGMDSVGRTRWWWGTQPSGHWLSIPGHIYTDVMCDAMIAS